MCNFCCKFASDFNMRGPIGRAEPYRTLTLQDGDKRLQDGQSRTGRGGIGRAEPYRIASISSPTR